MSIIIKKAVEEIFYALTGALVVFVILEIVRSGIVLAYININWVLILWLASGIVVVALPNKK